MDFFTDEVPDLYITEDQLNEVFYVPFQENVHLIKDEEILLECKYYGGFTMRALHYFHDYIHGESVKLAPIRSITTVKYEEAE